jgi:hypothetical protein
MTNNYLSFENELLRGEYARKIRKSFEDNNLNNWWIAPSPKTSEILIQPREYKEWMWENFPTISRISIQISEEGKLNFGVSGYHQFQILSNMKKFEERGYKSHQKTVNKYGKKERGRWWLIKSLENLESIVGEFKEIEHLLFEKD